MAGRVRGRDTRTAAAAGSVVAPPGRAEKRPPSNPYNFTSAVAVSVSMRIAVRCRRARREESVKIYTKTGDTGETSLFDKTRVSKADPRVDAYGEVDELNACLGAARAARLDADLTAVIEQIQSELFAVGARLADPSSRIAPRVDKVTVTQAEVQQLESMIDRLGEQLPPLRRFILPGGSTAGALLHLARTVCRRAERRVVALGPDAVDPIIVIYLNRLSDLLFMMARVA